MPTILKNNCHLVNWKNADKVKKISSKTLDLEHTQGGMIQ
ncbi:hypothetical protein RV02_GL002967 [Enterococcus gilvus]|nr:hypothetical protein RV02_GL002967 [Enterococcus gilvus]